MLYKAGKRVVAGVLSGLMICSGLQMPVYAETTGSAAQTEASAESGTDSTQAAADQQSGENNGNEEGSSRVLLASAGFSYSFSANKVSLADVKDNLETSGGTDPLEGENNKNSTADTHKEITDTSLTPVQQQEQSVVKAVSQTQGIDIDNSTATILAATAVTVVSDAQTAVSLAKLADRKQAQAKLDQGVISAGEAEALMAASASSNSVSVDNVSDVYGAGIQGETVVISIPAGEGESGAQTPAGAETDSSAAETESAAASADPSVNAADNVTGSATDNAAGNESGNASTGSSTDALTISGKEASESASTSASGETGTAEETEEENSSTGASVHWEKIPENEVVTKEASSSDGTDNTSADSAAAENSSESTDAASTEKSASDASASSASSAASTSTATTDSAESKTAAAADSAESNPTVPTDSDGNELVVAQVDSYINIRADASQDADIIGKLYNGSVAHVLGRTGNGWARVQSGDVYGYIREEYVATGDAAQQLADAVSTKQAVVTTMTLRVRAAAEADSDVITLVGGGQTLDILEEEDGWYKINTPDGVGYISADFADAEDVYPEAVSKAQEEAEEAARKAEEEAAQAASESAASDTDTAASASDSSSSETAAESSGSSLNTYSGSSSEGTTAGQAVVNYALQFVGNPYVWGGSSLTNGTDCSGFTMAVYANFGYSLPHYTGSQMSSGTAVASLDEALPGDLILYNGHVGIYMGNNQIVHASNPRTGITIGKATYRNIVAIRRIIN